MAYFSTDPGGLGEFGCGADCSCKSCRSASNVREVYEKEEIAPPAPANAASNAENGRMVRRAGASATARFSNAGATAEAAI